MKRLNIYCLLKRYGFYGGTRLLLNVLVSKILYPKAKLIRMPFYIRNEGRIVFGTGFTSGPGLIIDVFGKNSKVVLGKDVKVNHNVHIGAAESVSIGNRVLIASGVYISDHSHGSYSNLHSSPAEPPNDRALMIKPVQIGDDCWLGERVIVLPGVVIGKGVVVGAGAVVTKNLPDYTLAIGVPARVIKVFDFEKGQWILAV